MYHVALPVAPDDDHVDEKVAAVVGLPHAAEAVQVTLVHVADPGTAVTSVPAVADALAQFAEAGVTAESVRAEGHPSEALLDVADERDADCICVAGRDRTPAGKRQLTPGSQRVLLTADRPVLVAGSVETDPGADHV